MKPSTVGHEVGVRVTGFVRYEVTFDREIERPDFTEASEVAGKLGGVAWPRTWQNGNEPSALTSSVHMNSCELLRFAQPEILPGDRDVVVIVAIAMIRAGAEAHLEARQCSGDGRESRRTRGKAMVSFMPASTCIMGDLANLPVMTISISGES